MKILVTGSSGMIGSELVPALEARGHDVYGLDKNRPKFTKCTDFYEHDLMSKFSTIAQFDLIIHLAANARVWELVEDPSLALENIITTHNIFEFARLNKVPKILIASSREVYGNDNELPVKELVGSQRKTESTYAASKLFGEAYSWAYERSYGLDTKVVRFSNVYGKFDFSDRFIPKVIKQLKKNEKVEIWGNKVLDFTYITDAVDGLIHLVDNWEISQFKEWNIASGVGIALLDVAEMMKTAISSESAIEIGDSHPGEVLQYEADITRMQSLGWNPKITIQEGLARSIEYYNAA